MKKSATWNYEAPGGQPKFIWFAFAIGKTRAMRGIAAECGGTIPAGTKIWPGWDHETGPAKCPKGA